MKKLTTEDTRKLERILKDVTEFLADTSQALAEGDVKHNEYHALIHDVTHAVILKANITSALAEYGRNGWKV
jgi:hypothetical protein